MANKFNVNPYAAPSSSSSNKSLHFGKFPSSHFEGQSSISDSSDLLLHMKYGHSSVARPFPTLTSDSLTSLDYPVVDEPTTSSNGIADLERAFGDRNMALGSTGKSDYDGKLFEKSYGERIWKNDDAEESIDDDPSNSDVDCEEIDDV